MRFERLGSLFALFLSLSFDVEMVLILPEISIDSLENDIAIWTRKNTGFLLLKIPCFHNHHFFVCHLI